VGVLPRVSGRRLSATGPVGVRHPFAAIQEHLKANHCLPRWGISDQL